MEALAQVSVLGLGLTIGINNFPLYQIFSRKSKTAGADSEDSSSSTPLPPELPANEKAPWINIPSSSFAEDWSKLVNKSEHADVTFELERASFLAHKFVLCSASDVFRVLLGVGAELKVKAGSLPQCSGWSKSQWGKVKRERERGKEMEGILSVRER